MKNYLLSALLILGFISLANSQTLDLKLKPSALVLEGGLNFQGEIGLSSTWSMVAGAGYLDSQTFPSVAGYLGLEDKGITGELGFRYYSLPYFGIDQTFIFGKYKFQTRDDSDFIVHGMGLGAGSKFVFKQRIVLETYVGMTFGSTEFETDIVSSMPFISYGFNVGYRILGETTRGTPEYYGAKARKSSKKKSSSKKKKKKKKKRRRR